MAILDVQRLLTTLQKMDKQVTSLNNAMNVVEGSIATAPTITQLTENLSALPQPGDFSDIPAANTIVDATTLIPESFASDIFIQKDSITSFAFETGNTVNEFQFSLSPGIDAETPITFWVSASPGGPSIVQNAYVIDRALAVNISAANTLKINIENIDANNVYTHGYLSSDKKYYLNFTHTTFGNFNRGKMAVDFEIPAGIFNTSVTLSGEVL